MNPKKSQTIVEETMIYDGWYQCAHDESAKGM